MCDDEINELLVEAFGQGHEIYYFEDGCIEKFARLVAAKEREACIEIVVMNGGSVEIEAHIRQRGGSNE